jgi:hypothetical protein
MERIFIKECFLSCGGRCLSHNAVHKWVKKREELFTDEKQVETEVWKWLRQQPKDFYALIVTQW